LYRTYGTACLRVAEMGRADPTLNEKIHQDYPYIKA
jgi:hypothetical protein